MWNDGEEGKRGEERIDGVDAMNGKRDRTTKGDKGLCNKKRAEGDKGNDDRAGGAGSKADDDRRMGGGMEG